MVEIVFVLSPYGGIGRHKGFKIPRLRQCEFESLYGHHLGSWCNGNTTDSKSVNRGSIPLEPAIGM